MAVVAQYWILIVTHTLNLKRPTGVTTLKKKSCCAVGEQARVCIASQSQGLLLNRKNHLS